MQIFIKLGFVLLICIYYIAIKIGEQLNKYRNGRTNSQR